MNKKVGIIGVGLMGSSVARRLVAEGIDVFVRDTNEFAIEKMKDIDVIACNSPREMAENCDVIISFVVNSKQVDEVLFAEDGAAQAMRKESIFILCSTVSPSFSESLNARLSQFNIRMLDSPVSGGPEKAILGQISMMIAGDNSIDKDIDWLLPKMSDKIFRISAHCGDGAKMKIVNNMIGSINLAASCEGMALGERLGLDPQAIFDVVMASAGGSYVFNTRVPRIIANDFSPKAAASIFTKDLGIALETAKENLLPAPLASAAHQIFVGTLALGFGDDDDSSLIKYYRSITKTL